MVIGYLTAVILSNTIASSVAVFKTNILPSKFYHGSVGVGDSGGRDRQLAEPTPAIGRACPAFPVSATTGHYELRSGMALRSTTRRIGCRKRRPARTSRRVPGTVRAGQLAAIALTMLAMIG